MTRPITHTCTVPWSRECFCGDVHWRRDVGPFWFTVIENRESRQVTSRATSLTLRVAGREWTIGIRLWGWVE